MFEFLVSIVFVALLDFVYVTFFWRLKKGKYRVVEDSSRSYVFQTNIGEFRIDRESREFRYAAKPNSRSIPFADIKNIEYQLADNWAWIQELFFGLDITDLFGKYQDSDYWYSIYLSLSDGQRLPIFVAGQHKQREFLLDWYIEVQKNILESLGLFKEVHQYSALMLDELRDAFRDSGLEVTLK